MEHRRSMAPRGISMVLLSPMVNVHLLRSSHERPLSLSITLALENVATSPDLRHMAFIAGHNNVAINFS